MTAINFTTLRSKLKEYFERVIDQNEAIIVTRKNERNVILISLAEYDRLIKVEKNAEYLAKLDRGIKQIEEGRGQEHELIEV
ncbi:MAG: prevent-host-death protein [Clostridiales bacterium]|nr:MAG: prevent-host-death protein [Clostridiales bacterium]